jgi:site-specific recombinase XerD
MPNSQCEAGLLLPGLSGCRAVLPQGEKFSAKWKVGRKAMQEWRYKMRELEKDLEKIPRGIFEKIPGSKTWWIRYADTTGRIRREKAGPKGAAIKLYQKRKTEVLQRKKLPETWRRRAISFAELVEDALAYSKANKRSYKDDVYRMKRLKDWFSEWPAESVTPHDIEKRLLEGAEEENLAPATLNRYRALLSLVYRLGMESGKVPSNPARLVKHRRENNGRIRWLNTEEETKLRKAIKKEFPEHMPEFDFALNTGLRLGEMYNLEWEDVNLEKRVVTVLRSKNGDTRRVPLNGPAVVALETLNNGGKAKGPVFLNTRGERLTSPRYWFDPSIEKAGIEDFTWHCLRHTFASRLVMAGVDLRTVQELLGHKSIQMTCRYSHLAPTHQLAAVEKLAEVGKGQPETSTDTKTDTGENEALEEEVAVAL